MRRKIGEPERASLKGFGEVEVWMILQYFHPDEIEFQSGRRAQYRGVQRNGTYTPVVLYEELDDLRTTPGRNEPSEGNTPLRALVSLVTTVIFSTPRHLGLEQAFEELRQGRFAESIFRFLLRMASQRLEPAG